MKNLYLAPVISTLLCAGIANASSVDIYAHRGYRAIAPENTLPAYQDAFKIGVDVIDVDVQMTKDKVLIVAHDLTLNKDITKDENNHWIMKSIPIKSLTLDELKSYDVGSIKPDSKTSNMYPNHQNIKNVHMPTLREVIQYLKLTTGNRVRLQIEIKTDPTDPEISSTPMEMAVALNKLLIETNMVDQVEVQAFQWQALIDLHKINPKIKTAYLTDHTTDPMSAKDAKLHSYDSKWTFPIEPAKFDYNYPKMVAELHGTFWEPYEGDLTKKDLDEAHKLGVKVVTWSWTELEKTDFNYKISNTLINWGVDGMITDRPDILRGVEASDGLVLPPTYPSASTP